MADHKLLGEILLEKGLITDEVLDEALESQKASMRRIGEELVDMGAITEGDVIEALSEQLNIPIYKCDSADEFPEEIIEMIGF